MNKNKEKFSGQIYAAIDAEWYSTGVNKNVKYLSVQISFAQIDVDSNSFTKIYTYIYIHDGEHCNNLKHISLELLKEFKNINIKYTKLSQQSSDVLLENNLNNPLGNNYFLEAFQDYKTRFVNHKSVIYDIKNIKLLMFYSINDLISVFSLNFMYKYFIDQNVTQNKYISGKIKLDSIDGSLELDIIDLMGLGNSSLVTYIKSLGLDDTDKNIMDEFKSNMLIGLIEKPYEFIKYASRDTTILFECYFKQVDLINEIINNILKLPYECKFTYSDFPKSTGALVRDLFLKSLLYHNYDGSELITKAVFSKLAILKLKDEIGFKEKYNNIFGTYKYKNKNNTSEIFKTFKENYDKMVEFEEDLSEKEQITKNIVSGVFNKQTFTNIFDIAGISCSTIQHYLGDNKSTARLNVIRYGGRVSNFRYKEFLVENTADVDMVGCYGHALKNSIYPLGIPSVYATTSTQINITLGKFMDQNKDDLIDGVWVAIVSGTLSYIQDIILSKVIVDNWFNKINNKFKGSFYDVNEELNNMSSSVLTQKEIVNGVITNDVYNILKRVCSSQEFSEINALQLRTAVYHKKSDMVEDWDVWRARILVDPGEICREDNNFLDDRTKAWYPYKLENFIGNLLSERNKFKKLGDVARSNSIKLIINTLYGSISSPFFQINNTIVSNNITAKARINIWLMAKPLGLIQGITDGGPFTLSEVLSIQNKLNKKPGLAKLSNYYELLKHRNITISSLGGMDWKEIFNKFYKDPDIFVKLPIDELILKQIKEFWLHYGIEYEFDVECKPDNYSFKTSFLNRADYAFKLLQGELIKVRGSKVTSEYMEHPNIRILRNLINENKQPFQERKDFYYIKRDLLSLKVWVNNRISIYNLLNSNLGESKFKITIEYIRKNRIKSNIWSDFINLLMKNIALKNTDKYIDYNQLLIKITPGTTLHQLIKTYKLQDRITPLDTIIDYERKEKNSKTLPYGYEILIPEGLETVYDKMQTKKSLKHLVKSIKPIDVSDNQVEIIDLLNKDYLNSMQIDEINPFEAYSEDDFSEED